MKEFLSCVYMVVRRGRSSPSNCTKAEFGVTSNVFVACIILIKVLSVNGISVLFALWVEGMEGLICLLPLTSC